MNKFATYRHSALDAKSNKLVENEFTLKNLNQVQDDNLLSSLMGEARWGATCRANSPVETVIVPRHPQTKSGEPAFEKLLNLTTSWIPVLCTRMTVGVLGGAL